MQKPETLTPSICGKCGVEERHLLLHVRCRSISRRLCPSCILRSHQQYFCPTCYAYYGSSPPTGPEFVNCTECYSVSHSRCAAASTAPYLCPLCVHPHSPIFAPRRAKDGRREIDSKSATILFTAARIAASTMEKAAEVAKAEAEKRAKEAACTRKRAKEALEHIALLEVKERLKRKEISSAQASGSGNSSVLDRNLKPCNVNNTQIPKKETNRVSNQLGVVVDGPNEVSARLNAVGLKEKDRLPAAAAFTGPVEASPALKTIGTVMDDNERKRVLSSQNVAKVNNGLSSVSAGGLSNNSMGAKANSGLYSPVSLSNNSKTGLYPGGVSNNSVGVKAKTGLYSQNPGGLSNNSMGAKANAGLYSATSTGSQNVGGASNNSTLAKANNGLHSVPSAANSQNVGGSTNSSSAASQPPFSHPTAVDRQQNIHAKEESPFRKQ